MASSKNNNLIIFLGLLKTLICKRSYVNSCLNNISSLKIDWDGQIKWLIRNIINTMNQSLIQIKNQHFFVFGLWQSHRPLKNLSECWLLHNFHVLKWLKSLNKMHFMNIRGLCLTTVISFVILYWVLVLLSLIILVEIAGCIVLLVFLIMFNFVIRLFDTWSLESHLLIIYCWWILRGVWWYTWRFNRRNSKTYIGFKKYIYLLLWVALLLIDSVIVVTFYFFTFKLIILY